MVKGLEESAAGERGETLTEQSTPQGGAQAKKTVSRRRFLQIIGAGSAAGVAGCSEAGEQKIFPLVRGEAMQVPGVATWYRSTCTECSAGCGIQVRNREGRAVKIEGNPLHPVNRGSLCAVGQSAVQALYDPDRVRQPMQREVEGGLGGSPKVVFRPISWDEAYARIAERLAEADKKKIFFTGEMSGAIEELLDEWSQSFGVERVTHDPMQPTALARASELVFGEYGVPTFSLADTDVVVSFGADFLETWVSPCEFAREWAHSRRSSTPLKFIHIEPRLSLTGANADVWLSSRPGSEGQLALYVLKELLSRGFGAGLRPEARARAEQMVAGVELAQVSEATGIEQGKILLIAQHLASAKRSLVLAGGAAAATSNPMPLFVAVNLINLILGNVGRTVQVSRMRRTSSSLSAVRDAISSMQRDEVGVVFVHGTNPEFTLPSAMNFKFSVRRVPLVVSFSSYLDETAQLADIVLPVHHQLEDWGDARTLPGVYSLVQPAMAPLWDSRGFGDQLIQIARVAKANRVAPQVESFRDYLKASWQRLAQRRQWSVRGDFEEFWRECLERGGYFDTPRSEEPTGPRITLSPAAFEQDLSLPTIEARIPEGKGLVLYPFPSVRTFDGRAANRPWLHEVPDPISQVVWDAWAEIHPTTAAKLGIANGDVVTIRNYHGEINVPAYLTEFVHPEAIAVPLGHGHTAYGRYAQKSTPANVTRLLPGEPGSDAGSLPLVAARVEVRRGRGRSDLVTVQGSNSQMGRGLAQVKMLSTAAGVAAHGASSKGAHGHAADGHGDGHGEHDGGHGAHGHDDAKQMYVQREHPLYKWGMTIDLSACTGCMACVVACYAENNIPVVGKEQSARGREMSWIRIERYLDGTAEELQVNFLPMLCQHCNNAPCEPVCPVYATYHNEEGLNAMVYNRCVGTRYCSNNCSYKVRRFNWFEFELPEPLQWQLNPDVVKRGVGVMEKCTFCVQRIAAAKDKAKDEGRLVADGEVVPACVQTCPTEVFKFGNLNDPESAVAKTSKNPRAYKILDHHINTQPSVSYLKRVKWAM